MTQAESKKFSQPAWAALSVLLQPPGPAWLLGTAPQPFPCSGPSTTSSLKEVMHLGLQLPAVGSQERLHCAVDSVGSSVLGQQAGRAALSWGSCACHRACHLLCEAFHDHSGKYSTSVALPMLLFHFYCAEPVLWADGQVDGIRAQLLGCRRCL